MTKSIGIELPGLARMAQVTRAISQAAANGPPSAPAPMRVLTSWQAPCSGGHASLSLPNRVVMAPMPTGTADAHGLPSLYTLAWYAARARGGVGMIIVEQTYVALPVQRSGRQSLCFADTSARTIFATLADSIRQHGANPAINLDHSDRRPFESWSRDDLHDALNRFGDVAGAVQDAGFAAVHLSLDSSSFLGRALASASNRRTDRFGRGPRGRQRLVAEVVHSVGRAGLPVIVRIPCKVAPEGSAELQAVTSLAVSMVDAGATVIEVVPGPRYDDPSLPLVAGNGEAILSAQCAAVASGLSGAGRRVPVVIGGRIVSPTGAEAALAVPGVDAVSIGRALIADPAWIAKVREGIDGEIVPCIGCLACFDHPGLHFTPEHSAGSQAQVTGGERIGCVTNGDAGDEAIAITGAESSRRIAILGTGLPGLEFARIAASRGHEVIVVPDGNPLGGITGLRSGVPGNAEYGQAALSAFERLRNLGVTVSGTAPLDVDITVDARPPSPIPVRWGTGRNVLRADEVLGRDLHQMYGIGRRVAVCGAGALAAEVALFLAGWGRRPTVFVSGSDADPFPDVHPMYASRLRERLLGYKCALVTSAKPSAWRDARDRKSQLLVHRNGAEIGFGPFHTAIDCDGWSPTGTNDLGDLVVGDAHTARTLLVLVRKAVALARSV